MWMVQNCQIFQRKKLLYYFLFLLVFYYFSLFIYSIIFRKINHWIGDCDLITRHFWLPFYFQQTLLWIFIVMTDVTLANLSTHFTDKILMFWDSAIFCASINFEIKQVRKTVCRFMLISDTSQNFQMIKVFTFW